MRRFLIFTGKVTIAHLTTYLIVGAIAYQLLTKEFYVGPDPVFAKFMRTEADPEIWGHVLKWFIPGQILRGTLIALALYPFFDTLMKWPIPKRAIVISGLYLVIGYWAAAVAAPGNIEGLIYLRPEITSYVHLKVQPEIIAQGLLLGILISVFSFPDPA